MHSTSVLINKFSETELIVILISSQPLQAFSLSFPFPIAFSTSTNGLGKKEKVKRGKRAQPPLCCFSDEIYLPPMSCSFHCPALPGLSPPSVTPLEYICPSQDPTNKQSLRIIVIINFFFFFDLSFFIQTQSSPLHSMRSFGK